jgi:hypothetical protein
MSEVGFNHWAEIFQHFFLGVSEHCSVFVQLRNLHFLIRKKNCEISKSFPYLSRNSKGQCFPKEEDKEQKQNWAETSYRALQVHRSSAKTTGSSGMLMVHQSCHRVEQTEMPYSPVIICPQVCAALGRTRDGSLAEENRKGLILRGHMQTAPRRVEQTAPSWKENLESKSQYSGQCAPCITQNPFFYFIQFVAVPRLQWET